jgi:hypothetical protein
MFLLFNIKWIGGQSDSLEAAERGAGGRVQPTRRKASKPPMAQTVSTFQLVQA